MEGREKKDTPAQAESDLAAVNHLHELFAANVPAAMFVKDLEGRYTLANPLACEALGRPGGIIGLTDYDLLPKDLADILRRHDFEVVSTGRPVEREETVRDRRFFSVKFPLLDAHGRPTGVCGVAIDITERERAEKELQRKERELTDFIENAAEGLHWAGPDGIVLWANQAELDLLGYGREEYIGRHVAEFHADKEAANDILCRLASGETLKEYEARLKCKDGSIKHVLINSNGLWEDGKFIHSRCFTRDITKRKQAEESLRESEERFRLTVEASPYGILVVDAQGQITLANTVIGSMFGYDRTELIGRPVEMLVPGRYRGANPASRASFWAAPLARGMGVGRDLTAQRKDGTEFPVEIGLASIEMANRRMVQCSVVDITGRKRAEDALRQAMDLLAKSNEELETRVAERTAELVQEIGEREKLQEQLLQSQKMETVGVLAGGIAHDFNNILNIIQGYTSLLSQDASDGEEITESLRVINETIERGAAMVRQLLTLARKTEFRLELTDLNPVLDDLIKLLRETIPKTIDVKMGRTSEPLPILADPNQITQALLNLCVNACDAMPSGGTLMLATQIVDGADLADGGEEKAERYVGIEVRDTGTGMDEATQSRIFDPFFTTKGPGKGTGLGLAVVYGIVKGHNGTIQVDSAPTGGTTFRVYLPEAPSAERPVEAGPEKEAAKKSRSKGRGTVLVVEDEEYMLCLLENILSERGYRVLTATDGEEAIEVYRRHKKTIDVVLLDIGLPKMAGKHVFLKMKEENPTVTAIITSGYLEQQVKTEMHQAGVKRFIHKPYTLEEVAETVTDLTNSEEKRIP